MSSQVEAYRRKVILRVPVYRENREQYYDWLRRERDKRVQSYVDENPDSAEYWRNKPPHPNPHKIAWDYNRVIGWIEFCVMWHGQIEAWLWFVRSKKVFRRLSRNRVLDDKRKIITVVDVYETDNEHIQARVTSFLRSVHEYVPHLKRYFVDTAAVERLLPFIDFVALRDAVVKEYPDRGHA